MITDVESDPRHAGQIERYHTWPTIRRQSVGEHSWQVMRIMMTVDPVMCTENLMWYAVLHDVGEMAGDVPWPGKQNDPELRRLHEKAERRVRDAMTERWCQPELPELTVRERVFFKVCECLEMWEFGLQERSMGNKYGTCVAERMRLVAAQLALELPQDTQVNMQRYVQMRLYQESETNTGDIPLKPDDGFTMEWGPDGKRREG